MQSKERICQDDWKRRLEIRLKAILIDMDLAIEFYINPGIQLQKRLELNKVSTKGLKDNKSPENLGKREAKRSQLIQVTNHAER